MQGEKKYRLRPFMVGWYEASMRRFDSEFAELFEQFIIEGGGERVFAPRPGLLGVVPQRGTLKPEWIAREPHLDIDAHFERHERFLVIPCVCKREVEVLGHPGCRKPMKRCGFVGLPPQTPLGETVLDREEAKALLAKLEKQGHVHLAFYGYTMFAEAPQFMGTCNCCSCCCGLLHGPKIAGLNPSTQGPQKSNYRAVIDVDACTACGTCITRCPVDAISEDPAHPRPDSVLVRRAGWVAGTVPGASVVDRDEVHRLRRVRDRLPRGRDRYGAGFRGGVVPRAEEHGRVGGDAPRVEDGYRGSSGDRAVSPVKGFHR